MSIAKRITVGRTYSYRNFKDPGIPGHYRKLSEEETAAEWKRFKEQPVLRRQSKEKKARPLSFAFGSRSESDLKMEQDGHLQFGSQDFSHKKSRPQSHSVATLPGRLKNIIDAKRKVRRKTTGSFNLGERFESQPELNIKSSATFPNHTSSYTDVATSQKQKEQYETHDDIDIRNIEDNVPASKKTSAIGDRKGSNTSSIGEKPPLPDSSPPMTLVSEPEIIQEYRISDLELAIANIDGISLDSHSSDASSRKELHHQTGQEINFDNDIVVEYNLEPKMANFEDLSDYYLENGHRIPKTQIAYYGPVYLKDNRFILPQKEIKLGTEEDLEKCDTISSCSSKSTSSSRNRDVKQQEDKHVMDENGNNEVVNVEVEEKVELQKVTSIHAVNNPKNTERDVSPEDKFEELMVFERKNSDEYEAEHQIMEPLNEESVHLEIDVSFNDIRHGDSDSGINGTRDSASVSPMSSPSHSINISPGSHEISQAIETLDDAITSSAVQEDTSLVTNQKHQGHFVVVAIDFGTTYSGYAFSFTRDPNSIHMMRKWEGGDPGVINQKTTSTILLTPDGEFHSFGFSARDNFHDLDENDAKKWFYFENFKMLLHHAPELSRDTLLMASNGKVFPALTVFAFALQFFKDHALQELSDQSGMRIINEDIRWVITVPAIWKAPAKQFMRQAAYEAGLISPEFPEQLVIALEPEVASIYCRKLKMHQLVPECIENRPLQSPEKTKSDPMNLDPACADFGYGVDKEFEELLKNIFGKDFIEAYKLKRPAGWVDLMVAFESRKRSASPQKSSPLNVSLPFSFIDYFKKHKSGHIENVIKKHGDKNIRWTPQGMLRLSPDAMNPTIPTDYLKYLFLVGGFAESEILQHEIRKEFGHLVKIIIPQGVAMSILKGAVLFGLDPTVVSVRRSRLTYGVGVLNRYNSQRHPKDKRIDKDGCTWCTDVFDKYVEIDQPIALGDVVLRSYTPAKSNQKLSQINIYCSEDDTAMFITDEGVRKCGSLRLDLSDLDQESLPQKREIQTRMQFGETEIRVSALDVVTGRHVQANIDFLSR
ncbi:hypothetical protein KUTeg_005391 [Tegillarca granosa]|uniref:Heat shock 70 kDa protein 12A n=1 Tax=Tegillarca granosa TaxID=220873 RepID=A0ABQ9FNH2_TEGGR|nr:hypothetical protein KUTeg_005391 [Tegillarca granosa]